MKRETIAERLRTWWGNLSISRKMMAVMLLTVFLVAFLLTLVYYFLTADISREYTERILVSSLNHATVNLDLKIDAVEKVLYNVSTSNELQTELTTLSKGESTDDYGLWEHSKRITEIMVAESLKEPCISGMMVFDTRGNLYSMSNFSYDYDAVVKYIDFEHLAEAKGSTVWFNFTEVKTVVSAGEDYVALPAGKVIYNSVTQQVVGYVIVYTDTKYFLDSIQRLMLYEDDVIFLQDRIGGIVGTEEEVLAKIESWPLEVNQISRIVYDGANKYIANLQGDNDILKIIFVTRNTNDNVQLRRVQNVTVFMLVLTGILSLLVIRYVSRSVSKPILTLAEDMKKSAQGNFAVQVSANYNDEVGILRRSFNDLLTEIRGLIDNVYKVKLQEQEAQLRMLQMQINPHFLYNTLDIINWLAQFHGANDVAEVSRSLGYLMHFSLAEKELVSLEEEMDAVEHYMLIQAYRYGEQLKIEIQMEEEALYETVPRHIILPLIENSIDHGLKNKAGEKRVRISARIQGNIMCIEISDNGVGMSPKRVEEVLMKCSGEWQQDIDEKLSSSIKQQPSHMSIGLQNVNRRICLRYGEAYRIQINSAVGEGTTITLRFPYQEDLYWEDKMAENIKRC